MKKLIFLLSVAFAATSCSTEEMTTTNSTIAATSDSSNQRVASTQILNTKTQFVITASTRGFSSSIVVKNNIVTKSSTGVVPPTTSTISAANVQKIKITLTNLFVTSLASYPAPSCASCGDRGLSEKLEITQNGVTYTSQSYDSSNPPAEIKKLVSLIKSF